MIIYPPQYVLFVAVWVQITPNVKKQRTANIHDDLENSSEQREIDSIEEPVRSEKFSL